MLFPPAAEGSISSDSLVLQRSRKPEMHLTSLKKDSVRRVVADYPFVNFPVLEYRCYIFAGP